MCECTCAVWWFSQLNKDLGQCMNHFWMIRDQTDPGEAHSEALEAGQRDEPPDTLLTLCVCVHVHVLVCEAAGPRDYTDPIFWTIFSTRGLFSKNSPIQMGDGTLWEEEKSRKEDTRRRKDHSHESRLSARVALFTAKLNI